VTEPPAPERETAAAAASATAATPAPAAPAAGDPAPGFMLADEHGAKRSLEDALRENAVLVLFYPYAFSRVCGGELRELREALPQFTAHGVQPLAVSCDPMYALRVYAEQEEFGFPLLSDFWPHGATARAYGVFDEGRGCALRGSFLVDKSGMVRWSVVNAIPDARPMTGYLNALALMDVPA
jgi:peroxiredoxin